MADTQPYLPESQSLRWPSMRNSSIHRQTSSALGHGCYWLFGYSEVKGDPWTDPETPPLRLGLMMVVEHGGRSAKSQSVTARRRRAATPRKFVDQSRTLARAVDDPNLRADTCSRHTTADDCASRDPQRRIVCVIQRARCNCHHRTIPYPKRLIVAPLRDDDAKTDA